MIFNIYAQTVSRIPCRHCVVAILSEWWSKPTNADHCGYIPAETEWQKESMKKVYSTSIPCEVGKLVNKHRYNNYVRINTWSIFHCRMSDRYELWQCYHKPSERSGYLEIGTYKKTRILCWKCFKGKWQIDMFFTRECQLAIHSWHLWII